MSGVKCLPDGSTGTDTCGWSVGRGSGLRGRFGRPQLGADVESLGVDEVAQRMDVEGGGRG